jgi:hypothetical protein
VTKRFFEDPLAFRPERWTEAFEASLPKLAWSMRLAPGYRVEPHPRITLRPKNGVLVTLRRRG